MKRERGQSMVEATLVLLVFFGLLLGVIDCGQVLFAHQALVDRVNGAVRWATLHPFDADQVTNLVLYNQTSEPAVVTAGFLGLTRANVQVRHQLATADRPDDETVGVAIVNYESHFFSPWISKTVISARPVFASAPAFVTR
jgi:Flp pilus assembly protein TadG